MGRPTHRHTVLIELTFPEKATEWIRLCEPVNEYAFVLEIFLFDMKKALDVKDTLNGDGFED